MTIWYDTGPKYDCKVQTPHHTLIRPYLLPDIYVGLLQYVAGFVQ
jgi:hypothetical protein